MLIIDRFEGEYAVVETDGGFVSIPRADVPADAKEGDVLRVCIDEDGTRARAAHIKKLMDDVFED